MIIQSFKLKTILLPASILLVIALNHQSFIRKRADDVKVRLRERDLQSLHIGEHVSLFKNSYGRRGREGQMTHVQLPPCVEDLDENLSLLQIDVTYAYEMTIEKMEPDDLQSTINNAIVALEEAIDKSLEEELITSCYFSDRRALNIAGANYGQSLQIQGLALYPADRLDSSTSCKLITDGAGAECIRVIGGLVLLVDKDTDEDHIKGGVSQALSIISNNFGDGTYATAYEGIIETMFVGDELISYHTQANTDAIITSSLEQPFPKRLSYILIASISAFLILAILLFGNDGIEKEDAKPGASNKNVGEEDENTRRMSELFYFPNQAVVFDTERKISERRKSELKERRVSFIDDSNKDVLNDTESDFNNSYNKSDSLAEKEQSSNSLQMIGDSKKISDESSKPKTKHHRLHSEEEQSDLWTYQVTHNFI